NSSAAIGRMNWLETAFSAPDLPSFLAAGGFIISGGFLLGIGFYDFYLALMPEVANRALYWVTTSATALLCALLLVSGATALIVVGDLVLLLVAFEAVYAYNH